MASGLPPDSERDTQGPISSLIRVGRYLDLGVQNLETTRAVLNDKLTRTWHISKPLTIHNSTKGQVSAQRKREQTPTRKQHRYLTSVGSASLASQSPNTTALVPRFLRRIGRQSGTLFGGPFANQNRPARSIQAKQPQVNNRQSTLRKPLEYPACHSTL